MPDKSPEEKDGLLDKISKILTPIGGFLGAVTLAYNFYKMWLGEQETVTYFTAGGGLIILILALGWIGLSTKTVIRKKKTKSERRYSITYRRIALGLLGAVVIGSGISGWLLYQNSLSQAMALKEKIVILVAQFDGPEETYGLRAQIMEELHRLVSTTGNLIVIDSKDIITAGQGSEYARTLGEQENADLVIWAWYKSIDNPNITIHFENLSPTQIQILKSSETYQPQATLSDLNFFEVQQRIGAETKTLISFIVGEVNYQAGNYQEALDRFSPILLEKNMSVFIDPSILHFKIAHSYVGLGSYEIAVKNYDQALFLNPTYSQAYNDRGASYSALKVYDRAIQDFDKAIELEPSETLSYVNRGIVYGNLKQYDRAIQEFNTAIQLRPDDADAYINRGIAYGYLLNYSRAIEDFDKAIDLSPNDASAYSNRGAAYRNLQDYQRAIENYTKAIQLDPKYSSAYYNRGIAYSYVQDYEHALIDYDKSIELNPRDVAAYNNQGLIYENRKDYSRAIMDYDKAIEIDPGTPVSYINRGNAYFNMQDYERAITDFSKAIKLDPSYAIAYLNRGIVYRFLGETVQAEADFAKYKELTGQDAP